MEQEIRGYHLTDANGSPAGGMTTGMGIGICWQNGPLGRGEDHQEPSGAFVEGVIAAAIDRIKFYQNSKFKCHANRVALELLRDALDELNMKTYEREERGVEGTGTA